jgi:hypothetical protein
MSLRLKRDVDNRCGAVVLDDTYRDVMGRFEMEIDDGDARLRLWMGFRLNGDVEIVVGL